jgi:hypothetical protein
MKLLVVVAKDEVFVVVEVSPESEVVAITPLIVVVNILVEVAKLEEFPVMIVLVAITPLMLVVKVLPAAP